MIKIIKLLSEIETNKTTKSNIQIEKKITVWLLQTNFGPGNFISSEILLRFYQVVFTEDLQTTTLLISSGLF